MGVLRDVSGPLGSYNNQNGGAPGRASAYGDAYALSISSKEWVAADEGSYFVARTPTPGTGIIGHAAPTTFDETKPYVLLYNASTTKRIYPQFLRLHDSVASIGGARTQFTVAVDTGNRYASGGTALTIVNPNMDSNNATGASAFCGAVIASAASGTRRVVDHVVFRGTIDIIEDVYELVFAASDGSGMGGSRAATVQDMARLAPPVCIGPGQSFLVHQWAASQSTGPTFQVTLGYIER